MDELPSPQGPDEQQKEDITFFTSFDEHFGHLVSSPEAFMLCNNENFSLHFRHIYSYIGISGSFKALIVCNILSLTKLLSQ